jgi:hypothetical protein
MLLKVHIACISSDTELIIDEDDALFFWEDFRMYSIPFFGSKKLSDFDYTFGNSVESGIKHHDPNPYFKLPW